MSVCVSPRICTFIHVEHVPKHMPIHMTVHTHTNLLVRALTPVSRRMSMLMSAHIFMHMSIHLLPMHTCTRMHTCMHLHAYKGARTYAPPPSSQSSLANKCRPDVRCQCPCCPASAAPRRGYPLSLQTGAFAHMRIHMSVHMPCTCLYTGVVWAHV